MSGLTCHSRRLPALLHTVSLHPSRPFGRLLIVPPVPQSTRCTNYRREFWGYEISTHRFFHCCLPLPFVPRCVGVILAPHGGVLDRRLRHVRLVEYQFPNCFVVLSSPCTLVLSLPANLLQYLRLHVSSLITHLATGLLYSTILVDAVASGAQLLPHGVVVECLTAGRVEPN